MKNDRVVKEVPEPPKRILDPHLVLGKGVLPNWLMIKKHLAEGGVVSRSLIVYLTCQCKFLFEKESSVIELDDPVTIIGDIHGQFYDLLLMIERAFTAEKKILFLGDYVDRGNFSVEVLVLLFAMKLNYPDSLIMLRGNHESRMMTSYFSFRKETINKYDLEIYELIMETFDCLPLACIINKNIFAVHGGISPSLNRTSDIYKIDRFQEPPINGIFCDLLWSDPDEDDIFYSNNISRGCSIKYGLKALKVFLAKNKVKSIIRAHEMQVDGYKLHLFGKQSCPLITIFSAANYCKRFGNKGAYIKLEKGSVVIEQFKAAAEPFDLPYSMDALQWSVPFAIESVLKIVKLMVKGGDEPINDLKYEISQAGDGINRLATGMTEEDIKVIEKRVVNYLRVIMSRTDEETAAGPNH